MARKSRLRLALGAALLFLLVTAAPAAATSSIVISQFRAAGGNEFVELTNVTNATATLQSGWSIFNYRGDGNFGCSVAGSGTPVTLAPGQRYLIAEGGYTLTGDAAPDARFATCGDLQDSGTLELNLGFDPQTGFYVGSDSVAYGTIDPFSGLSINEPDAISPVPSDGKALRRKNGTQDTDSNKTDFEAVDASPLNMGATAPAPTGTTEAPTAILDTSAKLNGKVTTYGATASDCHFELGTDTGYGTNIPCSTTPSGQGEAKVSATASGLSASTGYHYRLVVTTSRGTLTAGDQGFTTLALNPPPTVTTESATQVGSNAATLNGTVNPHSSTVSDCHFEYGPSYALSAPCSSTPSGADQVGVSADVSDLDPSTTYAVRLVVTTGNPPTVTSTSRNFDTTAVVPDTDKIVISQFRASGEGYRGFVELLNISDSTVELPAGWSLNSNSFCPYLGNAPAVALAPGQHLLIGERLFTGADLTFNGTFGSCSGLFDYSGGISLNLFDYSTFSTISSDTVAWGPASYVGTTEPPKIAAMPTGGLTLQRRGSGRQDTHRNRDDFHVVTANPIGLAASAPAPTGSTDPAGTVAPDFATLNGTVNPRGGRVTDCHFDYGTDTGYGSTVPCASTPSGTFPTAVSATPTGLTPLTEYHYRLVVTTSGGKLTAGDQSVTTEKARPVPTGSTGSATKVAAATATLGATVNPHGADVTDCHFDLGTSTAYGTSVPCAAKPSGNDNVAVSGAATDLTAATRYHFRISVTTANGTLTGDDAQFDTRAVVPDDDAIVISQFRTRGVTGGDFVELMNISKQTASLPTGWTLTVLTPDGNNACSLVAGGADVRLAPGQHYLVTQTAGAGDAAFTSGFLACGDIADDAGTIALSSGDGVTYGPTQVGAYVPEPDPIVDIPSDGKALERRDGGTRDTGNNLDDFHPVTANPQGFAASAPPADLTTDAATNVGSARATLNGTVNPAGETISGCQFQYGTDADFASSDKYPHNASCNQTPSGLGSVSVSATPTSLTPSTGYHYRLVATGSKTGSLVGGDQRFTTSDPPTATTDEPTTIGSRSASLNATVNPRNETVTDCHFDYGTDTGYGSTKPCSSRPSGNFPSQVTASLTGLSPSTGYHVRIHITTSVAGERTGSDRSFSTAAAPSPTTDPATGVGHHVATINGTINPHGETVTDCHFEYGTDTSYGTTVSCGIPSGTDPVPLAAALTGLQAATEYHVRLVVTTSASGKLVGDDVTFSTTTPPSATTDDFSSVGSRSATLNGTVNPRGEVVTLCRFDYGPDTSYGSSVPCPFKPSGTSATAVAAPISGLTPNTDYHARLVVVTSSSGAIDGADRVLTTTSTPVAVTNAASDLAPVKATLNGSVNPHGETVTDCHFDYGPSDAYGSTAPCASTPSGTDSSSVSAPVAGLTPASEYHARLVVKTNGSGETAGDDRSFNTTPAPYAETGAGSSITSRAATLSGSIDPRGETISDCRFEYGPTTAYGSSVPCASTPSGTGATPVSAAATGLDPSTEYHVRLRFTSSLTGDATGADRTFKTLARPSATTSDASGVDTTSATLHGSADPSGEVVTDCRFEYGTTTDYGSSAPCEGVPPSSTITGLAPGTSYHVRIVLTTAAGTVRGDDVSFTTAANPSAPPDPPAPPLNLPGLTQGQLATAAGLSGTKDVSRSGTVSLGTLSCPLICGTVALHATMPLSGASAHKKITIGRVFTSVRLWSHRTLKFQLSSDARKALDRARRHRLTVVVTVAARALNGKLVTVSRTLVLRRR